MPSVAPARPDGGTIDLDGQPTVEDPKNGPSDPSTALREASPNTRTSDVAAIFDDVAPVSDRLGSILSLGMEGRWREAVVASAGLQAGDAAIDVAAGTGKLAAVLADRVGPFGRVVAVDLSQAMVERGIAGTRDLVQIDYLVGDALRLPFEDGSFDAATIAFGLGALPDLAAGLREMRRVVRPAGRVVCLEPTMPRPRWWGAIYHGTARRLVPLAVSVAGRRDAYRQVAALVRNVPDPDTLADLMRAAGLVDVGYRRLGLGAVALHVGSVARS